MNRSIATTTAIALLVSVSALSAGWHWHRPRPHPRPTPAPIPEPTPTPTPDPNWTPPPGIGGDRAPWTNNGTRPTAGGYQVVPWVIAVADTRRSDAGTVEIEWLRAHKVLNGVDTVVVDQRFPIGWTTPENQDGSGGSFGERNLNGGSWFQEHRTIPGFSTIVAGYTSAGILVRPSDYARLSPSFGAHWWGSRSIGTIQTNATVWVEANVRITGSCVVEVGADFHSETAIKNSSGSGLVYHDDNSNWRVITSGK